MYSSRRFWVKEDAPEYVEGKTYSAHDLELMADDILRKEGRRELCRTCGEMGEETGDKKVLEQEAEDEEGNKLVLEFAELKCSNDHSWYQGEGKRKGYKDENQILFEEHLIARKRREIYSINGSPDPEIASGSYFRSHPGGRKLSSAESRSKFGSSFYS